MLGRVHLITDSRQGADPVAQVRELLEAADADLTIQFRPGERWPDRAVFDMAAQIRALCRTKGVRLLVNDRLDMAMAVDADGVHLGADDLPVRVARRLLGPARTVGATARTPEVARQAVAEGADYVGVGPCYRSFTKEGLPDPLGPSGVAAVAPFAPVIAIGGVTCERVPELLRAGAHGVAVIGAVADAPDPVAALAELLAAVRPGGGPGEAAGAGAGAGSGAGAGPGGGPGAGAGSGAGAGPRGGLTSAMGEGAVP